MPLDGLLRHLIFLLHVDELVLLIVELVLQECQFLTGNDSHAKPVLHLPAAFEGDDSLIDEGGHVGVYVEGEAADADFVDETVDLALQLVGEQDARLDFSCAVTCGTAFLYCDVHCRAYALTCDLHESEFAQRQHIVFRAVAFH